MYMGMEGQSIRIRKRRITDEIGKGIMYLSVLFSVCLAAGITGYVLWKGAAVIDWQFLTGVTSVLRGTTGIAGNIINTLYMVAVTLAITTPIGVGAAIYLNEYAVPGRLVQLIEFTTEVLAGIPSIIFGLFGMVFFGSTLGLGYSILTGALTLTVMILPLIIRNTQEALKAVPASYRMGALGLGAAKWYMVRTILLPAARPGIVTGIILAVGRIVGESAALLFTAGSSGLLPARGSGLLEKIFTSGGTMTIQLYLSMSKADDETAFGIGAVLLLLVLLLNSLARAWSR